MKTKDLIIEATSLPVEARAIVIDCLLKSLNPLDVDIENKWAVVAKNRLNEIRNGHAELVHGKEVFGKIGERFSR